MAELERMHIAFFGKRNAGKSSLVNAVTAQELSLVSPCAGTTTDPVKKAMELLPLGPVLIIDTPGIDDEGELGTLRVRKARQVLGHTDLAVLVVDAALGLGAQDRELLSLFEEKHIPALIAYNKCDLLASGSVPKAVAGFTALSVSAREGTNIQTLKESLAALGKQAKVESHLVADLLHPGDAVLLVIPLDAAAPKGRLILPQQMVLRDVLDAGAIPFACTPEMLPRALALLPEAPSLVITDSQVFGAVNKALPPAVPLTSFSILMARCRGTLLSSVRGVRRLASRQDGDVVLISEGCTHHRQCGDIGTVKLPAWVKEFTGKNLRFAFTSGGDFPEDLSPYSLVIHCGGCMLSAGEMKMRIASCEACGTAVTNYGMVIAHVHGILARSLAPLGL